MPVLTISDGTRDCKIPIGMTGADQAVEAAFGRALDWAGREFLTLQGVLPFGFVGFSIACDLTMDLAGDVVVMRSAAEPGSGFGAVVAYPMDEVRDHLQDPPRDYMAYYVDVQSGDVVRLTITDPQDPADGEPGSVTIKSVPLATQDGRALGIGFVCLAAYLSSGAPGSDQDSDVLRGYFCGADAEPSAPLARQEGKAAITHVVPNSKAAHMLTHPGLWSDGGLSLDVTGRGEGRKGSVHTDFVLACADGGTLELSYFDGYVHAAISTLYARGNRHVTAAEVCRTMRGLRPSDKVTQAEQTAVRESVERQMSTICDLDYSKEMRRRTSAEVAGKRVTNFHLKRNLVYAKEVHVIAVNGKETTAWELLEPPALLEQAGALQQVVTFPQRLLAPLEGSRDTQRSAMIRNYVVTRVHTHGAGQLADMTVLLRTVAEHADMDTDRLSRKQVDYILKQVGGILDRLEGEAIIAGWTCEKQSRAADSWAFHIKHRS